MEETLTERPRFESVKDFAKRASSHTNLIYSLVAQNKLPHTRLGRKIMIPVDALDRMVIAPKKSNAA